MVTKKSAIAIWIKDLLWIGLLVGTLFGINLGNYPVAAPDGARYAEIPREMVANNDYLTPRLNGVKYFEKPPLFYWMQALNIRWGGATEQSVSLANAFMAWGSVLIVYLLGYAIYGRRQGIAASLMLATSALTFALARTVTLDVALTFFLTAALTLGLLATRYTKSARTWSMLGAALATGAAVMTKGLVGILFPVLIGGAWFTLTREWRNLKSYHLWWSIILFLAIVLPWHILVQLKNPEFFRFYFIEQHFLRYFTSYADRSQAWWFFPTLLFAGLYPWGAFLFPMLQHELGKFRQLIISKDPAAFLIIWAGTIYLFYTFSHSQLIPYILPVFPPLTLLIANYGIRQELAPQNSLGIRLGFYGTISLGVILGVVALGAAYYLDFTQHALTPQSFYQIAGWTLLGSLLASLAYRYYGLRMGWITILITTMGLWLTIGSHITTINRQSIKPLITTLQRTLQPGDEVICYGAYYQDLPFYLQKTVTVANFTGELSFGIAHQPATKRWMIDHPTFVQRWQQPRTIYLIIRDDHYHHLVATGQLPQAQILDQLWDTYLVRNHP